MKRWMVRAAASALALHMAAVTAFAAAPLQQSTLPLADSMVLASSFLGGEQTLNCAY